MPLATPSNIAVSRLYRVSGENQIVESANGRQVFGPQTFEVYGNVTWTNEESGQHAVILTVAGREILLTKGATAATSVYLATYTVPELTAKTIAISVVLKSSTETSGTASFSATVNGHQAAAFSESPSISGNNILLPAWTGAVNEEKPSAGNAPNLSFALGDAVENRFVAYSSSSSPLGGLIQNQTYRARFTQSSAVSVATGSYVVVVQIPRPRPEPPPRRVIGIPGAIALDRSQDPASIAYELAFAEWQRNPYTTAIRTLTIQSYAFATPITSELFFLAPAPVIIFAAQGATFRALKNSPVRRKLEANYRSTWAITSGNPGGFGIEYFPTNFGTATGPDEAYLVGTPTSSISFTINLTATRADAAQTATATLNMTVVDSLPRTVITTNSSIAREGVATTTSDSVSISFEATPSPASWTATGLPPGVSIDQQGSITGRATKAGTYFASITAKADDFDVSLPATIKFTVTAGQTAIPSNTAAQRSPWLLNQWELTDLHITARSRAVESTLLEDGALRIKLGDAINFAVFFVDSLDAVFAMAPSQLRLTIRKADNLDDLIIFKSDAPPTSATQEGQTYYLMPVTTGNREREVAIEWAEENGNNDPLECVADMDWIKDGKTYSSRTFPVLLELDVTRP